jgi:hypothetical protein
MGAIVTEKQTEQKRRIGDGLPGPGRKKGIPNRSTTEFRDTVRQLLENNASNVERWLTLVAEGDGSDNPRCQADPGKALDLMAKLAEFAAPKLARTEVVGDKTAPQHHVIKWQDD